MAERGESAESLFLLTFLDLWVLGQHRLIDVAPWKPLVEQSPVLANLAKEPRGTRIADRRLRNLPMIVGLAPISAYRTLDLPAVGSLTPLAMGPLDDPRIEAEVHAALRATGTGVRLIDPVENREEQVLGRAKIALESIDDPVLGGLVVRGRTGSRSRGRGHGSSRYGGPKCRRRAPGSCERATSIKRRFWTIGRAIPARSCV